MLGGGPLILLMDQAALPDSFAQDPSWLSLSEQTRLRDITAQTRRHEYLAARFAMRELLATAFSNTSWCDWILSGERNSAPAIVRGPLPGLANNAYPAASPSTTCLERLHLSLSHSAGIIAAVVHQRPIGVDIEVQHKPRPIDEMITLVCSEEDALALLALPPSMRATAFFRIWTIKEAYFKKVGTGLDWSVIRSLRVRADVDGGVGINAMTWAEHHGGAPLTLAICTDLLGAPRLVVRAPVATPVATGCWCIGTS